MCAALDPKCSQHTDWNQAREFLEQIQVAQLQGYSNFFEI